HSASLRGAATATFLRGLRGGPALFKFLDQCLTSRCMPVLEQHFLEFQPVGHWVVSAVVVYLPLRPVGVTIKRVGRLRDLCRVSPGITARLQCTHFAMYAIADTYGGSGRLWSTPTRDRHRTTAHPLHRGTNAERSQ